MSLTSFVTSLPIAIYIRPQQSPPPDWREHEHGPGYISLPAGHDVGIRARLLDDDSLRVLVNEVRDIPNLVYLNLAENRKISNDGIERLKPLTQLLSLNLSSVDLTNDGLAHLLVFSRLEALDLSYCNRITDVGLKVLANLRNLVIRK